MKRFYKNNQTNIILTLKYIYCLVTFFFTLNFTCTICTAFTVNIQEYFRSHFIHHKNKVIYTLYLQNIYIIILKNSNNKKIKYMWCIQI